MRTYGERFTRRSTSATGSASISTGCSAASRVGAELDSNCIPIFRRRHEMSASSGTHPCGARLSDGEDFGCIFTSNEDDAQKIENLPSISWTTRSPVATSSTHGLWKRISAAKLANVVFPARLCPWRKPMNNPFTFAMGEFFDANFPSDYLYAKNHICGITQ